MSCRKFPACLVWPALLVLTPPIHAETVTFELLDRAVSANDMSPDGRYIVGQTPAIHGVYYPYQLDTLTGTQLLLPPEGFDAVAVSDDGSVVLGDIADPEGIGSNVAAIWTAETGWQSLGHLPDAGGCPSRSDGYELSADGTIAVGLSWDGCDGRGFVWSAATGMLELEPLANGANRASVVSADGVVIGGFAQGSFSRTHAVWNGETLAGELLDPPDGNDLGEIQGISDDGTALLGSWSNGSTSGLASKWIQGADGWERETVGAGALINGWEGIAMDIADNGTVVGFDFLQGYRRAWIQPHGQGALVELTSYIESHGGDVPDEIPLHVCQAISANGRYIIGHGFNTGAWRVIITPDPQPGDLDCDGTVGFGDINAFVLRLSNPAAYQAAYPGCPDANGDIDGDGSVGFGDINPFVALLSRS